MANVQPRNIPKTIEEDQRTDTKESIEREGEKAKSKTNEIYDQKLDKKSKQITDIIYENSSKSSSYSSYSEQNLKDDFPSRLKYSRGIYYLILILNICLPGSGTIIAGCGWGNNRRRELIFRGIIQFFTTIFLVGWIQAIHDACYYFKYNEYYQ